VSVAPAEVLLSCHPGSACGALEEVGAQVAHTPGHLALTFRLTGDLSRVRVPPPASASAQRSDGLWRHTCCEAFIVSPQAAGAYLEWNFAPSGAWAAYRFDGYRSGMSTLETSPPAIELTRAARELTVRARIALDVPRASGTRLALAVVVEDTAGQLSYWALRHAPGRPDFHHPDSFALEIPTP
jgi:hypothetical protein